MGRNNFTMCVPNCEPFPKGYERHNVPISLGKAKGDINGTKNDKQSTGVQQKVFKLMNTLYYIVEIGNITKFQ